MKKLTLTLLLCLTALTGFSGVVFNETSRPVYEALPTNGLVLHYKMDEASWSGVAGEVRDSSGAGNHGTSYGGVLTNPGKFDRAGVFDGVNDYVVPSPLVNNYTDFSISLWVYSYSQKACAFIDFPSSTIRFSVGYNGAGLIFSKFDGAYSGVRGNKVISGCWTHVVGISTSGVLRVYVDTSVGTFSGYVGASATPRVGGNGNGGYYNGQIDDVRIYNRALSSNEVSQLYLAESYSKRNPPVIIQGPPFSPLDISGCALWLDGSDTSSMYDSAVGGSLSVNGGVVGRWQDKSGNNNHATNGVVANMPKRSDGARNGRTGILFDDTDFVSIYKSLSIGVTTTVFIVKNTKVDQNYIPLYAPPAGATYLLRTVNGDANTIINQNAGTPILYINGTLDTGTTLDRLFKVGYNKGVLYSLSSVNFTTWLNINVSGFGGFYQMTGDMYDILIYNRVLSTSERQQVERYLSAKWNVPLNNITSSDTAMDKILKVQTPINAIYVGTNRVYRFKNMNYPKTVK